jgi:hypothetical protein
MQCDRTARANKATYGSIRWRQYSSNNIAPKTEMLRSKASSSAYINQYLFSASLLLFSGVSMSSISCCFARHMAQLEVPLGLAGGFTILGGGCTTGFAIALCRRKEEKRGEEKRAEEGVRFEERNKGERVDELNGMGIIQRSTLTG